MSDMDDPDDSWNAEDPVELLLAVIVRRAAYLHLRLPHDDETNHRAAALRDDLLYIRERVLELLT